MTRLCKITAAFFVCISATFTFADESAAEKPVSFYEDIRPIFQEHCHGCHQPAKPLGDYVITTEEGRTSGGETGEPAIVAGQPDESYLVEQITPIDGVAEMPKNGQPLSASHLALIRRWIEEGANDDSPAHSATNYDVDHPPQYTRPPVITSLDYSPDGERLAIAGFHEVLIHRADGSSDGEPIARLIGMSERIESVRFSPDGTFLAATGGSPGRMGEVQVWDVASGELVVSLPVTFDTVYGASWSPDGKYLAFGCADNTVRVIEATTGQQVLYQGAHSDWVLDTVFSADGSHLASVGRDATAKLIEVPTERFVDNITSITPGALRGGINAVARHPERDEILFGGADGVPKIYQMHRTTKRRIGDDANLLWELPPLPGRIFSVDYSRDGRLIAAGSSLDGSGSVHLYGIEPEPSISEEITAILVKPTHERDDEEREQLKKHFQDGIKEIAKLSLDSGVYAISINHDATHIAAAGTDGQIRVLDAANGQVVHKFAVIDVNQAAVDALTRVAAPTNQRSSADKVAPAADHQSLPETAQIVRLSIQPEQITLGSSTEYAQIIVLAELSAGHTIDVTRMATITADSCVSISPTGMVQPIADGTTRLTAALADQTAEVSVDVSGTEAPLQPDFIRDVSPIFARAGCNAGTCHGAQDGKNGFKLSLRGYDPVSDVRAITDDLGSRRTNLAAAAASLFLLKTTGNVPHQGGVVLKEGSDYYRTLLAWIQAGAKLDNATRGLTGIEVQPINPVVQTVGSRNQMRVVASFADGSKRDVTREAFVESGDTEIAKTVADHPGLIELIRRGEAPVLVRYEGAYAATTITVIGDRTGFEWQQPPANNRIDELVHAKLERTKTATSALCDDHTFIRRVYFDLTGLPPTAEQIAAFVEDPRDSRWKRDDLIDQLIGDDEFVEHWTNKWADLLQVNSKFLGREGAEAFRNWIREEVKLNTPYDELARKILTADGSNKEHPAASYYKILREPAATMENTTHLFLATRFNCNKCHDHPFERWTQDQYYELSAYFARVGFKEDPASGDMKVAGTAVESAKPLYEIVYTRPEGEVTHIRTNKEMAPAFPFECRHKSEANASRRQQLASWISSPHNPYFAMSYSNRIWAYLTGRGLIEPIDDIRAGNPPTNPELLQWLTKQFVDSGFDTQHLIRIICRSRTYQLALKSNRFNADDEINYSHAKARRLPAEVLYDAIYRTTGAKSSFPGVPEGLRAAALPDVGIKLPDGFLNNLGRPARESSCECERSSDLQMGPVMALINGATVAVAISQDGNAIESLVREEADDKRMVEALFLRVLGRPAQREEVADAVNLIEAIDDEHGKAVTELEQYEATLAPIIEAREKQRLANLAEKQTLLKSHVAKIAPERERLAKERENKIADAQTALAAVRTKLLEGFASWEKERVAQTPWETLNPIELTSSFGETLEVREDSSVFASGEKGKGHTLFTAPAKLDGVTGVRIETLLDDQLPGRGPGRAVDGNFVLTELKLWAAPDLSGPHPLIRAWDFTDDSEGWIGEKATTLTPQDGKLVVTVDRPTRQKRLAIPLETPAGPLALDITAKLDSAAEFTLRWQTQDQPTYDESRTITQHMTPVGANWRTYRLYFDPKSPATRLRLKIHGGGPEIAIDAIRLLKADPPQLSRVTLHNAKADFSQAEYDVASAIDNETQRDKNGWAIAPQVGKEHIAAFETGEDYAATGDGFLRFKLVHNYESKDHSFGRFRISVTRSSRPHDLGIPGHLSAIVSTERKDRTDEQQAQLEAYFLETHKEFTEARAALRVAEKPVPPDREEEQIKQRIAELSKPLPPDAKLVRLQRAVDLSEIQLADRRLTAAQDIAWALINSPEFLYNH